MSKPQQLQCLVFQDPNETSLKRWLKGSAQYCQNFSELSHDNGTIWIFEIGENLPQITLPLEPPPILILLKSSDPDLYAHIVNHLHPQVILLEKDFSLLNETVERIQAQLLVRDKKKTATRNLADRNKELSLLAENLEKLVEERTQWIEISNREQKELIRSERRFVQFLIEIGLQRSQEDLLESFLQEFRQLRLAQEIYILKQNQQEVHLSYVKNHEIQSFTQKGLWWSSDESEILSESVVKKLAATFSRPIGRLLLFPLPQILNPGSTEKMGLLIEKGTTGPLTDSEFSVIKKYVQALGLSLARVKLEEDYRVSALLWEKIFDGARDPIAIINQDFEVVRRNQLFGSGLSPQKCYQVLAQRTTPCLGCPLANPGKAHDIQVDRREFQVISQRINEEGTVFLHRYVDVTDVRSDHIRFIQNEKLSSIGQIAEQMAHEIYNPLAGIIALVQILQSGADLSESTRSDLEEIQKAAQRAQKVIENLQEFVKQESALTPVTLDEIIEKTLPLLKMKWRVFRLKLELEAGTKKILVEPQLISQVVYNLIQNSCQAMKPGRTLTLRTELLPDFVRLTVSDEGSGIPDEIKASIFKPFYTTKASGEGTGLGLNLSKQIVERYNGRLYFHSQVNVGTDFIMEIPFETSL